MQNAWWLGQTNSVSPMAFGVGVLALWSVCWTGVSLWHAARRWDKGWFILFLVVHTAGIVEFLYLYFVAQIFTKTSHKTISKRVR